MELKRYKERFLDYYIENNKHNELQKYAIDLSKKIQHFEENVITIGNDIIDIPSQIFETDITNNIILDTYSNHDNSVYFVNPDINDYYKLGNEINVTDYYLQGNEILKLSFSCDSFNDSDFNIVILEYTEGKGVNSRIYKDSDDIYLLPHENTTSIKIYINPTERDFYYNLNFSLIKTTMEIINEYNFSMNGSDLYKPNDSIVYDENKGLNIKVPHMDKAYVYFSYLIFNNSFNKLPENSLIDINPNNLYQFHTPFILNDEIDFTPTIIEYNKYGKTNLIKLNDVPVFIRFQKDTTSIRLSYRFSGEGVVNLSDIKIIEYKSESGHDKVKWNSRHEIDTHMNMIPDVKDLRIAVIMDEFTYHSYKNEANIIRLSFDNWESEISSFMPHFIFLESSWHGNNGDWSKKIAYVTEEKHSYIKSLIKFSKSINIPVVFWNKEDPVHYEHFIETAKLCDYVFTTDQDRVSHYKRDCNHENVEVLQFAAQPESHNPTKIQKERIDGISFAGSYYALREERSKDMNRLFKASIPFNLCIYDRNYEYTKKGERLNFLFPEKFRKYILGTLPFYEIDKAYKGYKFMININTVKESPTMYARRVYEGLASGTPIISNYSLGMEKQFGDIIGYSEDTDELSAYIENLNENESEYNKIKQHGIRRVLSNHTYTQRLTQIAKTLGYEFKKRDSKIIFVSFVENIDQIELLTKVYSKIYYSNKELLVITKENVNDYSLLEKSITVMYEERIKKHFETLEKLIKADYIAPISSKDFYGENYLEDLLLPILYTNADIIGKKSFFKNENNELKEVNGNSEHEYVDMVNNHSSLIKQDVFSNFKLDETLEYLKGKNVLSELSYLGFKIYSTDKMNYIKNGQSIKKELQNIVSI